MAEAAAGMREPVSLSLPKRKREDAREIVKLGRKDKKRRKENKRKMEDEQEEGQDANPRDRCRVPAATCPHVGIDRINSNWKQIQATLKKSLSFRKFKKPRNDQELDKAAIKKKDFVQHTPIESLAPKNGDCSLTKVLAMDCEMVGAGSDGKRSILARVSLVNSSGNVIYDKHVKPTEKVTDFRTKVSGVRPSNLKKAVEFSVVQKEVADLIADRILVGHAVKNDLKIMYLSHPKQNIRDTAAYPPLRSTNGRPKSLRHIAAEVLDVTIQDGEHCSVQDARAAMYIYHHFKHDWESTFKGGRGLIKRKLKLDRTILQ